MDIHFAQGVAIAVVSVYPVNGAHMVIVSSPIGSLYFKYRDINKIGQLTKCIYQSLLEEDGISASKSLKRRWHMTDRRAHLWSQEKPSHITVLCND